MAKRKKSYILCEQKALSSRQNVMERYYGIKYNEYHPLLLRETTLDRILKKHGDNGFMCISANRSDCPPEVNDKNTRELISDIKQSRFFYLPIYEGHISDDTGVMDDFEPSFLVFNSDNNGNSPDFELLHTFALKMCEKHKQHSVMIKYPNSAPILEDSNGNVVSEKPSNTFGKNGSTKEYFTSLQSKDDIERKGTSYTSEIYVNPLPVNLLEKQRRKGEIMIWRI